MEPTALPSQIGKYKITGTLGAGAMGIVYRASDPTSGRVLAIKTIKISGVEDAEGFKACERFRREGLAGAKLKHPNIVRMHEYGEGNGIAFIVMDLLNGTSLRDLTIRKGRWSPAHALHLVRQLLDALEHLHKHGIVHRDIKPSNIIVDVRNHLTVTDFGIARLENSTLTQVGTVLGTPWYMSPEQITEQPIDGRSDLFSVGILLYEMLTGMNPFKAEQLITVLDRIVREPHAPPSSLVAGLPQILDALLVRALAKKPADRFQEAEEFRQAIRQLQAELQPHLGMTLRSESSVIQLCEEQSAAAAALEISLKEHEPSSTQRIRPILWLVVGLVVAGALLMLSSQVGTPRTTPQPLQLAKPLPPGIDRRNAAAVTPENTESSPIPASAPAFTPQEQTTTTTESPTVTEIRRQCDSASVERVLMPDVNGIVRCTKSNLCASDNETLIATHLKLATMLTPGSDIPQAETNRHLAEIGCTAGLLATGTRTTP